MGRKRSQGGSQKNAVSVRAVTVRAVTVRGEWGGVPQLGAFEVEIPYRTFTTVTGAPGAGKSRLVVDTLYGESSRLMGATVMGSQVLSGGLVSEGGVSCTSAKTGFAPKKEGGIARRIEGLLPAVFLANHPVRPKKRRTVLQASGIQPALVSHFIAHGRGRCAQCGSLFSLVSEEEILGSLQRHAGKTALLGLAIAPNREAPATGPLLVEEAIDEAFRLGFERVSVGGVLLDLRRVSKLSEALELLPTEDALMHPVLGVERVLTLPDDKRGNERARSLLFRRGAPHLEYPLSSSLFVSSSTVSSSTVSASLPFSAACRVPLFQVVQRGARLSDSATEVRPLGAPLPLSAGNFCAACFVGSSSRDAETTDFGEDRGVFQKFQQEEGCGDCGGKGCQRCGFSGVSAELLLLERGALTLGVAFQSTPTALLSQLFPSEHGAIHGEDGGVGENDDSNSKGEAACDRALRSALTVLIHSGLGEVPLARELRELSAGELLKFRAALLLLHEATELLILLDEPTRVLSPEGVSEVWSVLELLVLRGNTVVVAEQEPVLRKESSSDAPHSKRAAQQVPHHLVSHHLVSLCEISKNSSLQSHSDSTEESSSLRKKRSSQKSVARRNSAQQKIAPVVLEFSALTEENEEYLGVKDRPDVTRKQERGFRNRGVLTLREEVFRSTGGESTGGVEIPLGSVVCFWVEDANVGRRALESVQHSLQLRKKSGVSRAEFATPLGEGDRHAFFAPSSPWMTVLEYIGGEEAFATFFASLPVARHRGIEAARFTLAAHEVWSDEPVERGFEFDSGVLEVVDRERSVVDALGLSLADAARFFVRAPELSSKLEALTSLGLGGVPLGSFLWRLTWGERQRLRVGEVSFRAQGGGMLMEEPFSGLTGEEQECVGAYLSHRAAEGTSVFFTTLNPAVEARAHFLVRGFFSEDCRSGRADCGLRPKKR